MPPAPPEPAECRQFPLIHLVDVGAGRPGGRLGAADGAKINLTIPLTTLLGLTDHPGEAAGFGPIDADLARTMAAQAAASPTTTWCITVTDQHGHPTAHGCATPSRRGKPRRTKRPGGRPPGNRAGPSWAPAPGDQGTSSEPLSGYGTWRLRSPPGRPGPDGRPGASRGHRLRSPAPDHRARPQRPTSPPRGDPGRRMHVSTVPAGTPERCDFEHAIPWEEGGRTCSCNTGPCCRHHHHLKQAAGWKLEQNQPGYHTWTTPAGRRYTTGPISLPGLSGCGIAAGMPTLRRPGIAPGGASPRWQGLEMRWQPLSAWSW